MTTFLIETFQYALKISRALFKIFGQLKDQDQDQDQTFQAHGNPTQRPSKTSKSRTKTTPTPLCKINISLKKVIELKELPSYLLERVGFKGFLVKGYRKSNL